MISLMINNTITISEIIMIQLLTRYSYTSNDYILIVTNRRFDFIFYQLINLLIDFY